MLRIIFGFFGGIIAISLISSIMSTPYPIHTMILSLVIGYTSSMLMKYGANLLLSKSTKS